MKTRKTLVKSSLPRIYYIDRQISRGRYPKATELAREYEVSLSTITRDIAFMKERLRAPIAYDAFHRGFYYTEKTYRVPAGYAAPEDILALGMARNLLRPYRDTPLYGAACELFDSVCAPFTTGENPRWFENRIVVPPPASCPPPCDAWDAVIAGLRDNRVIAFDYRGTWDAAYRPRRARPYQLLFNMGLWQLYAWAEDRGAIRIFTLSRMRAAAVTEDTFTLPEDYDYQNRGDESWFGVFRGDKKYRFLIELYDEGAARATERVWATGQKILEETNEYSRMEFFSAQYEMVFAWLLSLGPDARPLEPERLVRDWREAILAMHKLL
jgi:predicted DNA-binding transcriptional regulator YafY